MAWKCVPVFLVVSLLIAESRMDSGYSSGDSDDSDDTVVPLRLGLRNRTRLVTTALNFVTRNASDFHYIARDDHEAIYNWEREIRRRSRKRGPQFCWKRCLRTSKCFEQMKNRVQSRNGTCLYCIAKCSALSTTQPATLGR